jgi:class 3 adenylate cyclase
MEAKAGSGTSEATILTFLIADIRGYTQFTAERGDDAAAELAMKFATMAQEGIEAHGGTLVELRGDEALAVFDSARQAIRTAVQLQKRFVDATVADPTMPVASASDSTPARPSVSRTGTARVRSTSRLGCARCAPARGSRTGQ